MRRQECYDERQLIEQGKAYKAALITAAIISIVLYFLAEVVSLHMDAYFQFALSLFVPVTVFLVIIIVKDAHDALNSSKGAFFGNFFLILGIINTILVSINCFMDKASGRTVFIEDGGLSRATGSVLICVCCLVIGFTYKIKKLKDRREYPEE